MLKRTLEQLSDKQRPPLSDRLFFWFFALLFSFGVLKIDEQTEE